MLSLVDGSAVIAQLRVPAAIPHRAGSGRGEVAMRVQVERSQGQRDRFSAAPATLYLASLLIVATSITPPRV